MNFPAKMAGAFHGAARATAAIYGQFSSGNEAALDREYQEHDYSRVKGPDERASAGRTPTDEDLLEWDIQEAKQQILELGTKIERQEHQMRSFQASIPEMRSRNAEVKQEIETVKQDLTATRAHAPEEGTMLREEVVNEFVELKKCVGDITHTFLAWCSHYINRPLSRDRAQQIRDYFQGKESMRDSDKFVQLAVGRDLQSITDILLRRYLCVALGNVVFRPFLPGEAHGDKATGVLSEILETAQSHESQERSGRWRALTYRQALAMNPRDEGWCVEPATSLVKEMADFMTVVDEIKLSNGDLEAAFQLIAQLFNAAAHFKDRAMMVCTEVDIETHLPGVGPDFYPGYMKEAYRNSGSSRKVALGVGLGLQLSCNVQKGSAYEREYHHPVPARVIGDKSRFFLSQ